MKQYISFCEANDLPRAHGLSTEKYQISLHRKNLLHKKVAYNIGDFVRIRHTWFDHSYKGYTEGYIFGSENFTNLTIMYFVQITRKVTNYDKAKSLIKCKPFSKINETTSFLGGSYDVKKLAGARNFVIDKKFTIKRHKSKWR